MRRHLLAAALALLAAGGVARAQPAVKLGVLTDMSSVYADFGGEGSIVAARMAIADSGMGDRVTLVTADHQNKPDVGASIAHDWFEHQGVDAIFDVPTSSVALAVNTVAGQDHKLVFFSTAIIDRITGEDCNGYGIAWTWNIYSVARSAAELQMKKGYDTWFIIAQDYAAGHAIEQVARRVVSEAGGRVLGSVFAPLGTTDFSSYLLAATASGARLVMLTAGGTDLISELKQAREFGVMTKDRALGTFYIVITDVQAVGLATMQGLNFVTAFYWDRDDATRAFAKRFEALHHKMPTMFQAGVYSAVLEYLKAVKATGSTKAETVRDELRSHPIEDVFARHGELLANGSMRHDMLVGQIKTPAESHAPWDYYNILGVVPADQAYRSAAASGCKLTP